MPDGDANADSKRMQVLLRRFEIPLLQFATRITGDRERARDVVQETFVKFQNNGAFQNPEPRQERVDRARGGGRRKAVPNASADFKFAAAVAEFGMLLRDSEF